MGVRFLIEVFILERICLENGGKIPLNIRCFMPIQCNARGTMVSMKPIAHMYSCTILRTVNLMKYI
uniref:Uncharacterized protein n=1 Tax=Anguilla anguilla TaxID=7936 RepID=A0A0E9S668_ANGAN